MKIDDMKNKDKFALILAWAQINTPQHIEKYAGRNKKNIKEEWIVIL
jgi:hypothetical protein